ERAHEVEGEPVAEGLLAVEHGPPDHLPRDEVLRPADVALDPGALAVRGHDGAARGAEVDPDVEGLAAARALRRAAGGVAGGFLSGGLLRGHRWRGVRAGGRRRCRLRAPP